MTSPTVLELWPTSGLEEVQTIIRAVYRQVLGNPHIMDSERLATAESKLADRSITVRDFARAVAKSDFYRSRYFEILRSLPLCGTEFSPLAGSAPQNQKEVSEHIIRCVAEGYEAENRFLHR